MKLDYFTQPEQGSRSAHDYGRTQLQPESKSTKLVGKLSLALVAVVIFYFAWEFIR